MKFVATSYADSVIVDALRVFEASGVNPDVGDARQMRGVEAADGSGSDDENSFHSAVIVDCISRR